MVSKLIDEKIGYLRLRAFNENSSDQLKKQISKNFKVVLRTAQRWYLILDEPEIGSFETIQNKKEVNRLGSSFLLDNLERLVLTDNKEEREEIEKEIEIISKSIKGVNQIRSH